MHTQHPFGEGKPSQVMPSFRHGTLTLRTIKWKRPVNRNANWRQQGPTQHRQGLLSDSKSLPPSCYGGGELKQVNMIILEVQFYRENLMDKNKSHLRKRQDYDIQRIFTISSDRSHNSSCLLSLIHCTILRQGFSSQRGGSVPCVPLCSFYVVCTGEKIKQAREGWAYAVSRASENTRWLYKTEVQRNGRTHEGWHFSGFRRCSELILWRTFFLHKNTTAVPYLVGRCQHIFPL